MSKAKFRVTVKPSDKKTGTLLASVPLAIVRNDHPSGKPLYQTRAQIHTRIERGRRPQTTRLKRTH